MTRELYLVTIGDRSTEHETFDDACGYARSAGQCAIIEHGAERYAVNEKGEVTA